MVKNLVECSSILGIWALRSNLLVLSPFDFARGDKANTYDYQYVETN